MKKYFLVACFALLLYSINTSSAQKPVYIGCKAGISIPNLTSGSNANPINSGYSSRLGANAAVQTEFYFAKHFSIQPQLEYSSQGGKKNGSQTFTIPSEMADQFPPGQAPPYLYANYKSVARINYLMLPVLVKYHFNIGQNWGAYVAAGPFGSLVLSAKNITSGSSNIYLDEKQTQPLSANPQSFNKTKNIRNDLHRFNAGISGLVGFNYTLAKGIVFIEGGGNYGFIDIQKGDTNGKNRTGAAVVQAGYQFSLCSKIASKKGQHTKRNDSFGIACF
jgi:Outer membrane protein beta-barrel domain